MINVGDDDLNGMDKLTLMYKNDNGEYEAYLENYADNDENKRTAEGNIVTFKFTQQPHLKFGTDYYVTIDDGLIEDLSGNDYEGIAEDDKNTWNFIVPLSSGTIKFQGFLSSSAIPL
jgi:hypothetical protein